MMASDLLDEFAKAALIGLIAGGGPGQHPVYRSDGLGGGAMEALAQAAYEMAGAMLAERARRYAEAGAGRAAA